MFQLGILNPALNLDTFLLPDYLLVVQNDNVLESHRKRMHSLKVNFIKYQIDETNVVSVYI